MILLMIGGSEIIFIVVLVLLLFGGKKIPELMKGLGQGVRSFKDGMNEPTKDDKQQNQQETVQNSESHSDEKQQ